MNILEILIQRQAPDGWPVVAKFNQTGDFLPRRWEGTLKLDERDLLPVQLNPLAYGVHLGERLFCDSIRDALREARAGSPDRLRVQLIIEAPELRHWRWETLCGPIGVGGKWQHMTLDQRSLYSLYLPSLTDRRFPAIGRQDLRALIVVANPPEGNRYKLSAFGEADAIAGASQSLGNIPHEVLAITAAAAGQPTIDQICWRLTSQHYTILHIVAHGLFRSSDGETILYLLDDKGDVRPITATAFIDRLQNLQGVKGLPHLIFLASCDSAASEAERAGAMGGLGQRLVRELGVPAVIAMTQRVSVSTANELASKFYERLNDNGDVVGALVDATAYLAEVGDITVPAIYERLGGRLLFDSAVTRELTNVEIISGLERLQALLADQPDRPGRAPVLTAELARYAAQWRRLLLPEAITTPRQQLSSQAQAEWLEAESNINALCEQALDLSFRALALGQEPASYDARCPFPGLAAFQGEFKSFFFGRENLVAKLVKQWQKNNFLAILGPSGSGKSSLVLAGIVPQMERENPNLQLVYMTPTANPLRQLAAAQLPEAGRRSEILLLVDQFEELFTLCTDEKTRRQFLDQLLALTEEMRVVITMRADFWGDCAPYPALRQLMLQQQELIAPMMLPELRSAMEQQADAVGLRFEDDLVHTILSEVEGESGAMPLLQHLLKGLWERRRGRWLLTREYRALGGIRQAIAVTAQTVYDNLNREEQAFMKHIFVRLTHLDESGGLGQQRRNTRRRVALQDLAAGGKTLSDVRAFVYRPELRGLLITSQRNDPLQESDKTNSDGQNDDEGRLVEVEVIHEAVIRHWGQLQEWLDQDYEMLRQRQRIQQEAADWRQAADLSLREGLLLLHGARLLQVKEWRDKGDLALNESENTYVAACDQKEQLQQQRELEQQRQLAEAQRQRAEEAEQAAVKQSRLTRIAFAVGGVALILFIIAGIAGILANNNARKAEESQGTAVAESMRAIAESTRAAANLAIAEQERKRADENANEAIAESTRAAENLIIAEQEREKAEQEARRAEARALAAQANIAIERYDTEDAYLLAIQAVNATYNFDGSMVAEAEIVLQRTLMELPFLRDSFAHMPGVWSATFSPDGQTIFVTGCNEPTTFRGDCPAKIVQLWTAAGELIKDLEGIGGTVRQSDFAPDGRHILTMGNPVQIWDRNGNFLFPLEPRLDLPDYATFSPDGQRILVVGCAESGSCYTGTALLWDISGDFITALEEPVYSASFSPDGQYIVTSGCTFFEQFVCPPDAGSPVIWDSAGNFVNKFDIGGNTIAPSFSADGQYIVARTCEQTADSNDCYPEIVGLWHMNGEFITYLSESEHWSAPKFVPNRNHIFARVSDRALLWDIDGNIIATFQGPARVTDVSQDGEFILTAGCIQGDFFDCMSSKVQIWDSNGNFIYSFIAHITVNTAVFSPDGQYVLTTGCDTLQTISDRNCHEGSVRVWEFPGNFTTNLQMDLVNSYSLSPDGQRIVIAGCYNLADQETTCRGENGYLWDWNGNLVSELTGHIGNVTQVHFSPDGEYIATASTDRTGRLWDKEGNLIATLEGHTAKVNAIAFTTNGQFILTASDDRTARLWDSTGRYLTSLRGHTDAITFATFSSDNQRILTASDDGTVRLWDTDGNFIISLEDHVNGIMTASFSVDLSHIFTLDNRGMARLWDYEGNPIRYVGHSIRGANISPDGQHIVVANNDRTAQLLNIEGNPTATFRGHMANVNTAFFSPNGRRVVTTSDDGTVRLWDNEGNIIATLDIEGEMIVSAKISPAGNHVIVVSDKGIVRQWEIYTDIDAMLDEAMRRVISLLSREGCLAHFDEMTCER